MEFWHYNRVIGLEISKNLGNTNTSDKVADFLLNFVNFDDVNKNTKFLEPAVGSGSFYFAMLEELLNKGFSLEYIVENMIYAYDIDKNALNILIKKLSDNFNYVLNENTKIFNTNFLLADIPVNFDYVITNPPYISNKNIEKDHFFETKDDYIKELKNKIDINILSASDLYVYFHIKSMKLLKENGKSIFLCSDSWIDSKFGEILQKYLFESDYNLDLIVNSQLYPFFRDDTNAILTVISKSKNEFLKVVNLREELTKVDFEIMPSFQMKKNDVKKIFENKEIINKRNALILFFDYYFDIQNFFSKNHEKFISAKKLFDIESTSLTQATMDKEGMIEHLTENGVPVFWQIQARVNKLPNYKNNIKREELTYSIIEEKVPEKYQINYKENNFYFSNIIDRFPLLFKTDNKTFHVSKYFNIQPKNLTSDRLNDIMLFNNVFTVLDMELRLKEGTRKTLRKGECGLAKEIKKSDLEDMFLPNNIDFSAVKNNIEKYANKVIYNIETALLDEDYFEIQKHIAKSMGFNDKEFKFVIEMLLFLYVLRMRNIEKINNFHKYKEDMFSKMKFIQNNP